MPHILTKAVKVSPNGFDVITYRAGEHEELPDNVVAHARERGALAEASEKKSPAKKTRAKNTPPKSED